MLLRLLALGTVAALAAAGCGDGLRDPLLVISEIQITGETDFGALDVEVHLFDEQTRAHLGCAGRDQGLEAVDASDINYLVNAVFDETGSSDRLAASDLEGRSIELIVIEDDALPCPEPPGPDDDVVGLAAGLDFATFDLDPLLSFDRVVALRVGFD